jgi:DNA polymerase III epsilon subunit-like protein
VSEPSFDLAVRPKRILGIDIENGTRWGWGPNGYTYSVIYGVAWKEVGTKDKAVQSILIDWRQDDITLRQLAQPLVDACEKTDCFLGHNFSHDWSGLQGLMRDLLLPFLDSRPTIDTFKDIPKHQGASRSLEDLCQQFGLGPKPHLSQRDWTEAFIRWNPEKLAMVRHRNETDVILTERLYLKERELGWL